MSGDARSPRPAHSRSSRVARAASILALVAIAATAFVKHQDEDNRFCVACHLHQKKMDAMLAAPPRALAAAHHGARGSGHPERCFTCHSGEGWGGWSQVTLLSAWDAARWVAGDRHEPTTMRLPLTNQACLKCHATDLRIRKRDEQKYHGIADHRPNKISCMACHRVHDAGAPEHHFLDDSNLKAQCQRCHRDLDES